MRVLAGACVRACTCACVYAHAWLGSQWCASAVVALIIAAGRVPILIAQARPEFSRSLAPPSCVTIIAGMVTPEKFPGIGTSPWTRSSVMITATAPAAWALSAFSVNVQAPRVITAMLPAICSPFSSGVQPSSGTATTVDELSTSMGCRYW